MKKNDQYIFNYIFTALLIIYNLFCISKNKNKKSPPNLIVFIADDVSWDDLGCYMEINMFKVPI